MTPGLRWCHDINAVPLGVFPPPGDALPPPARTLRRGETLNALDNPRLYTRECGNCGRPAIDHRPDRRFRYGRGRSYVEIVVCGPDGVHYRGKCPAWIPCGAGGYSPRRIIANG